ncbi:MAG: patatin-like phospholipase family protein [Gammaproteobacteria bacterium]|nr:patatin-like phospholipase family protein [Gammaproteobacteria bacterium]
MQIRVCVWLAGVLLAVLAAEISASAECGGEAVIDRPRIGLVLGGGGARGMAHIGVIEELERLGIPVDCIAGTSMGALVGGLYATGMSAAELRALVEDLDWADAFDDQAPRRTRPAQRRRDDLLVLPASVGIRDREIILPEGAFSGQKIELRLARELSLRTRDGSFASLPIPFRAVATDLATGAAVTLSEGSVARAMRASMSIPAVFTPIRDGERLLVDGALANNLPIDVVRAMGAEVIIAVDVATPLMDSTAMRSAFNVMRQLSHLMVQQNTRPQIASMGPDDILIEPAISPNLGPMDFDRAVDEIIPSGRSAALAQADRLRLHARPGATTRRPDPVTTPELAYLELDNRSELSDALVLNRLGVSTPTPLDIDALETGVARVHALGRLKQVRWELVEREEATGVRVTVEPDIRAPRFLQYGLKLSANNTRNALNLRLGWLETARDGLGAEWRAIAQIGEEPGLAAEYFQPLDLEGRFHLRPSAFWERQRIPLPEGTQRINEADIIRYGADMEFGYAFGNAAVASVGIRRYRTDVSSLNAEPTPSEIDGGEWRLQLLRDSLDDAFFPSRGRRSSALYRRSVSALGADAGFEQIEVFHFGAHTQDRLSLQWSAVAMLTLGDDAPLANQFRAGGFSRLSGYRSQELAGQHFIMGLLGARWRLSPSQLSPAAVGVTLEYGNVWEERSDIRLRDGLANASLYFGYRSPLGPLYIGYGYGEGSRSAVFLSLGRPF